MSDTPSVVMIVEDEPHMRVLLRVTMQSVGYRTIEASTAVEAIREAHSKSPDLVLLDLAMPDIDGVEVTRRIRERSPVPIIAISARSQECDKVSALDAGANDYVTKPFAVGELLARIRAALRGGQAVGNAPLTGLVTVGDLSVDFDLRRVRVGGKEVTLSPIEYELLSFFLRSPGRVFTHQRILKHVWGAHYVGQLNSLRVYVKKLRHKIEEAPSRPKYLVNEPGVGYRFRVPY
jgi:two-component system, OmpR family, KDP operon response regulator KdpE